MRFDDTIDELDVKSIPEQVMDLAEEAGMPAKAYHLHDLQNPDLGFTQKIEDKVAFDLHFETGTEMYFDVDQEGNVRWHSHNRPPFEMGNLKQPHRIVDSFFKLKDVGYGRNNNNDEDMHFESSVGEILDRHEGTFPMTMMDDRSDLSGLLIVSRNTGRILLQKRADDGTWGMWGGHLEKGEGTVDAAIREFREESRYSGDVKVIPKSKWVNNLGRHSYTNYIGVIEEEFTPVLDEESSDYKWFMLNELNDVDLHFGLRRYLGRVYKSLKKYYKKFLNEDKDQI